MAPNENEGVVAEGAPKLNEGAVVAGAVVSLAPNENIDDVGAVGWDIVEAPNDVLGAVVAEPKEKVGFCSVAGWAEPPPMPPKLNDGVVEAAGAAVGAENKPVDDEGCVVVVPKPCPNVVVEGALGADPNRLVVAGLPNEKEDELAGCVCPNDGAALIEDEANRPPDVEG